MPQWMFRSQTDVAVLDAPDWLTALPEALTLLGIPRVEVPRIAAALGPDGEIQLSVPGSGLRLIAQSYSGDDTQLPKLGEQRVPVDVDNISD